jgi:hypothetical protein
LNEEVGIVDGATTWRNVSSYQGRQKRKECTVACEMSGICCYCPFPKSEENDVGESITFTQEIVVGTAGIGTDVSRGP